MMKNFLNGLLMSAGLLLATQAQSAPVDFEDLHADGDLAALSSPYAGLNWGEDWYYGDTAVEGYGNGAHSGASYVTNGYGMNNLAVGSTTAFNFKGAWFATPNTNGAVASWINITAYDAADHVIGSTGNVSIGQGYQWVTANFANVQRLSITRDDGWFVMDDFTFTSAVPEPGSSTMLLAGLGLFTVMAARRPTRPARADR
jgi:endoglucanase